MPTNVALIADTDTLRAAGLRVLLKSHHELEAAIVSGAPEAGQLAGAAVIFVAPELFASAPDLFLPHRHRLVLITPVPSVSVAVLDPTLPHDRLVESLASIVTRFTTGADTPGADARSLSAREIDVLRLVARGYINKEIADMLGISFNTVLTHRRNITAKLGIRSVSGLGVYAVINGLITAADI